MDKITKRVLRNLKLREETAFDIVVNTYRSLLYGIIYKEVHNHADAEDILIETFQKMWDNVDGIEINPDRFRNWLITIAYNNAKNYKKKNSIYSEYVYNNEELVMESFYDANSIFTSIYLSDLKRYINEEELKILLYKDIHRLNFLEISKIINISDKTVKKYYLRAKEIVEKYYKGELDDERIRK